MNFYKLEGDQEGQGRFEEKGAEELLLWGHNSAIHFQIFQLVPGVMERARPIQKKRMSRRAMQSAT
jgi:hypothetical protein